MIQPYYNYFDNDFSSVVFEEDATIKVNRIPDGKRNLFNIFK